MHHNVRFHLPVYGYDDLRPNCTFTSLLQPPLLQSALPFWEGLDYRLLDVDELSQDFMVERDSWSGAGVAYTSLPVVIIEHILIPGDEERYKHLVHLATAMRSVLALLELHCLDIPALGLLIDRNIVRMVVGWLGKDDKVQ